MHSLADAFVFKRFEPHQQPVVTLNAGMGFCFVLGLDGEPERKRGPLVQVPLLDNLGGDGTIAKVLVAAGQGHVMNLGHPRALAELGGFWQKNPTPQAIVAHPGLVGKFFQPGFRLFALDTVPEGTLLFLRPPMMIGHQIVRGSQRGLLAYCQDGILTVRFASW